jgi:hypothetical protein
MAETCLNIISNTKHENQDMDTKYAKQNFDLMTYEKLNMKMDMGGSKSYFKMVLNMLSISGVLHLFIPFWGPTLKSFHGGFHMFILQGMCFKTFLIIYELSMNYK